MTHHCYQIILTLTGEGDDMGKKRNNSQYNMLYDQLYQDARKELRLLKTSHEVLQQRHEEALQTIEELQRKVKTQQKIIEELEGELH